jgi:hypothetical protein
MSEEDKEVAVSPKRTSTSWVKGQPSPNPKGRPSKAIERAYLNATVENCSLDDWKEIVHIAVENAKHNDGKAREWLSGYILGEPKKVHEYLVNEKRSVTIHVVWEVPGEIVEGESIKLLADTLDDEEEDE